MVLVVILLFLLLATGLLHAWRHLPASTYTQAMAEGQFERARQLLSDEAQAGNPKQLTELANLHYLGLGGVADHASAARLYHQAASKGYGPAQLNLGHLYRQGLGVSVSTERAFGWYIHAQIANNLWAEYYLSQLSVETTLTAMQMSTLKDRWYKLPLLAAEPL